MSILTKYKEAKNKLLSKFYYTPNNKNLIEHFTNTSRHDFNSIKAIINNKYYGKKINLFSNIFILSIISYFTFSTTLINFLNMPDHNLYNYFISPLSFLFIFTSSYIFLSSITDFLITKYNFFKLNKKSKLKSTISIQDFFNELLVNLDISNSQKDELKLLFKNALTRDDFIISATKNKHFNYSTLKLVDLLDPSIMQHVFNLFDQIINNYDNGQFIDHIDDFSLTKISTNQNSNLIPVKDNLIIDNFSNPELWTKIISLHNEIKLKITNNNIDINYFSIEEDKYIDSNLELLKLFEYNYSVTKDPSMQEILKNQLLSNLNSFNDFLNEKLKSINSFIIKEIKINNKTVSCLN